MKFFTTAVLLTLGIGVTFPALAQIVPIQSLRQSDGMAISGTVDSVVGHNFTLSDGSGEITVNAGPRWNREIAITPGEQLIVVGEYNNDEFDAHRITRASGEVITLRNGINQAAAVVGLSRPE
ncbi:MAG: DNA-binding protein [Leptolyngbya sp. DLM2.Bin27]|nr:MAG: DNA-binding protein [Leptolyngbya sp. DLM2.Bin27]